MKIQVGGLSEGVHEYSFQTPPAEIGLPSEFDQEVRVDAVLEKGPSEFRLRATIAAGATWECDRCVTAFRTPLTASYDMYYVFEGGPGLDPSEVQVVPASLNVIDIAEDVRQTVELSVPLKRVCRENCRGLCPYCGTNLNEGSCSCVPAPADSRWDKLKELKNITKHDVR
jgi:uncharacterized protein